MIKLYIDEDGYVEVGNNEQVALSFDELELLTGSKKLLNIIKSRVGDIMIVRRGKNNRLEIMDNAFKLYSEYINIESGIKYRCVKIDPVTNEVVLRPLVKRGKRDLLLANNVDGWMID